MSLGHAAIHFVVDGITDLVQPRIGELVHDPPRLGRDGHVFDDERPRLRIVRADAGKDRSGDFLEPLRDQRMQVVVQLCGGQLQAESVGLAQHANGPLFLGARSLVGRGRDEREELHGFIGLHHAAGGTFHRDGRADVGCKDRPERHGAGGPLIGTRGEFNLATMRRLHDVLEMRGC